MRLAEHAGEFASRTALGRRAMHDARFRLLLTAAASIALHLAYALYHGVLGFCGRSWWFIALCGYYAVLSAARFFVVLCLIRGGRLQQPELERFVPGVVGALLLALGCVLSGVNTASIAENAAIQYGEIVMITIAVWTFGKLTMAIVRAVRHRRQDSPLLSAIRGIGYAEAAASVLTLQRSMLVSFGAMAAGEIALMNALTGAGAVLFIAFLGIRMIKENRRKEHGKIETGQGQ